MVKMKDGEPNDSCPTSLAPSDCSFVVLENPSFLEGRDPGHRELSQSVTFPSMVDVPIRQLQHNGQADSYMVESISSNVSPEEIQKRLREVHQENLELKEMLSQNNLAMKNQLATLLAWQTQVKDVFQQHGEKFSETGALIHKLRAENTMLKNVIAEQKIQPADGAEGSKLEDLLKVENAELKQTVQALKQTVSELSQRPSRESPSRKEVELVSLLKEVNERLETVERSRRQMTVDLEREGAQRAKLERDVAQLKAQLVDEQRQKDVLREQVSAAATSKREKPSANEEALKRQLSEQQAQYERLLSDTEELSQELESLRTSLRSKEQQSAVYVEVQSQGFQEKLDRLTAQLVEREEAIARKDTEARKLQEIVKKLQVENEGLEILKAQVEVYQADFNAERESRERLAGEREQLLVEMSMLQRANQELTKELALAKRPTSLTAPPVSPSPNSTGWNTIAVPHRHPAQGRQPSPSRQDIQEPPRVYDEEVPPPRRYVCPLCNQGFQLLDHLEHHVETCIN